MSESAARAERFGLPAATSPGYLWEVSGKPVAVRINLDLVDRLEREVVESFRSLSSRGSEVGGLLLGTVQPGSPARVSVEAYELVVCDYARGPLYQLSEADVERFGRAAAQHSAGPHRVVGFFRSHTRKGLALDAEDLAFFSGHFRELHQIALLIRPYASKPSTGGIFVWENGAVRGEASYLEFPFRRSELERMPSGDSKAAAEKKAPVAEPAGPGGEPSSKPPTRAQIVPIASRREISMPAPSVPERTEGRPDIAARPAEPPHAPEPPAPSAARPEPPAPVFAKPEAPAAPAPEPKERGYSDLADLVLPPLERPKRSKTVWVVAGVAGALLLLSGALLYPGLGHKPTRAAAIPGQDTAGLSLHVARSAGELLLTWNRNAEAIKSAQRATLAISDGDRHENVNLDLGQLHNGSVEYLPTGSDVSFQLAIIGQNASESHSESVRVLGTRPSPLADAAPPAQSKASGSESRSEAKASPEPAPAAAASQPDLVADNREAPAAPTLKQFHAESLSARLRPTPSTDLPEAPGLNNSAQVAVSLPVLNATPSTPVAPPPAPVIPKSEPLKTGGHLQQAQLISSRAPEYPLVAKQAHVEGIVVINAVIGANGKVKSATAISGPSLLRRAAVDAVRQWIYRPTTLDGAPVESETRVEIRFTGSH